MGGTTNGETRQLSMTRSRSRGYPASNKRRSGHLACLVALLRTQIRNYFTYDDTLGRHRSVCTFFPRTIADKFLTGVTLAFLVLICNYDSWLAFASNVDGPNIQIMNRLQLASFTLSFCTNVIATLMIGFQLWYVLPTLFPPKLK